MPLSHPRNFSLQAVPAQVYGPKDSIPHTSCSVPPPTLDQEDEGPTPGDRVPWCQGFRWAGHPAPSLRPPVLFSGGNCPWLFGWLHHNTGSRGAAALSSDRRQLLTGEDSTPFVWVPKDRLGARGCRPRALPTANSYWGGSTFPIPDPLPGRRAPQVLLYLTTHLYQGDHHDHLI